MDARIVRHGDAQTFLRRARPWLLQTEPEHNLILGIAARADDCSGLYAATVEQGGSVVGCALRTPPRKLVLTRIPPGAIEALVIDVAACDPEIPAVFGPPTAAREFVRQWCERRGCTASDGMERRLYRLDRVIPPTATVNGTLCFAAPDDIGLVTSWVACFAAEANVDIALTRDWITARIAAGEMALWWDGEPRTLAGISGRSPNGVRIGYVYTPPEWRRRGYASACVAALSQHALSQGARFCCLYTDVANPVSNSVYQRLGYAPICDAIDIEFSAGA